MKTRFVLLVAFAIFSRTSLWAQIDSKALKEWKDQKYSMFIHFGGIYSVLGGVWNDKPVTVGLSEQIQAHAGIYSDTYARVARQFNPTHWHADSIALLAKNAGMRSIVITSKHHDGFCMFKTATTDFNVVDATPFKRDVVRELADACHRHGITFGLYFSLIDWHFPEASPISSHNSDPITPAHHAFNKQQITELLTNYGPVAELWFDMGSQSPEQSRDMRDLVHRLQPNCMIGSRIGNDMGDFTVMGDNQEPDYTIGVPWQSPASFFDETWGYRSWQKRVPEDEKYREKLTSLIRVVSRGGKYLLNIGPKGNGSVVPYEKDVLLKIGTWLRKNGDAIYGADPDPFYTTFTWGSVTSRPDKLYLHLLSQPEGNTITLPGLTGTIKSVSVLGETTKPIRFRQDKNGSVITLPSGLDPEKEVPVIVVELSSGYKVAPYHPIPVANEKTILTNANAYKHYSNSGVDYNSRFQSTVAESWTLEPRQSGSFRPTLVYTDEEKGKQIDLTLNTTTSVVTLDGDKPITLATDPSTLTFSPIYLAGPFESGIGGSNGDAKTIDPAKPWPGANGQPWQAVHDWKNGQILHLPADMTTAYYLLQEITAPADQSVLVRITSGDGLLVMLNGKQLFIRNNPEKKPTEEDILRLPLQKGKNQVLLKLFNTFQKQISTALDYSIPQVIYRKQLPPVSLKSGSYYPVRWQEHQPISPHRTLLFPNMTVEWAKE